MGAGGRVLRGCLPCPNSAEVPGAPACWPPAALGCSLVGLYPLRPASQHVAAGPAQQQASSRTRRHKPHADMRILPCPVPPPPTSPPPHPQICAVKAPGFGDNRKANLQDIAVLVGGQVGGTLVDLDPFPPLPYPIPPLPISHTPSPLYHLYHLFPPPHLPYPISPLLHSPPPCPR